MFKFVAYLAMVAATVVALAAAPADAAKGGNKPGGNNTQTLADLSCSTNQIAKFDGTSWICATDATADPGTVPGLYYEVRDATATEVGDLISIAPDGRDVIIAVHLDMMDSDDGLPHDFVANVNRAGFEIGSQALTIWFESNDCTGTAWISQSFENIFGFPPAFDPTFISISAGGTRTLHLLDSSFASMMTANSAYYLNAINQCLTVSSISATRIESTILVNDLHFLFPPPFTMHVVP